MSRHRGRPQIRLEQFVDRASVDELARWDELADLQSRIARLESHRNGAGRTPAECAVIERKIGDLRAKLERMQAE